MSADAETLRVCSKCGKPKPPTTEYFKTTKDGRGVVYLRRKCRKCENERALKHWHETVGRKTPPCPYNPAQLLAIRTALSEGCKRPVSWRIVAEHLGIKLSRIIHTIKVGTESGVIPPNIRILQKQTNLDIICTITDWLNSEQIGAPEMRMHERLKLAREHHTGALVGAKVARLALIASRQENAQLRAEIRELQRQQEKLWQVRESYRNGYEKPLPVDVRADDGYALPAFAETGD